MGGRPAGSPQKVPEVSLVDKLWAILLMKGDFNFFGKWVFRYCAINNLYDMCYILDNQYSQWESIAEDSKLDNRLTMDLSGQLCLPLLAISTDAKKCYDQINHIMMALLLCAISGTTGAVQAMLTPIIQMSFYQRMVRGDSDTFIGGRQEGNPLQGLYQGNRAAPACWLMMCSAIMACYKKLGHDSSIAFPMSGERIEFVSEIYADNLDLLVCLAGVYDCGTVVVEAHKAWMLGQPSECNRRCTESIEMLLVSSVLCMQEL
jgi:hypothetical protein